MRGPDEDLPLWLVDAVSKAKMRDTPLQSHDRFVYLAIRTRLVHQVRQRDMADTILTGTKTNIQLPHFPTARQR